MREPHEVSKPSLYIFLVMDGRARYDFKKATIIEVIDEYINYERVWNDFVKEYKDYDYCLVSAKVTNKKDFTIFSVINSKKDLELL